MSDEPETIPQAPEPEDLEQPITVASFTDPVVEAAHEEAHAVEAAVSALEARAHDAITDFHLDLVALISGRVPTEIHNALSALVSDFRGRMVSLIHKEG